MLSRLVRFLPLLAIVPTQTQCFWPWQSKLSANVLKGRHFSKEEAADSPCEDRSEFYQLTSVDGYAAAVYDGHGGWQVAHTCSQRLLKLIDGYLKLHGSSCDDSAVKESIQWAFKTLEEELRQNASDSYKLGYARPARVGSCALVVLVIGGKLYCANLGDSLAILISSGDPMGVTELNKEYNADDLTEQARLRAQFPLQEDVVVCRKSKSCFLKGRLKPTRAFGDFALKQAEFNNPLNLPRECDYQPPLAVFTGPYLHAHPHITVHSLQKEDKALLLASSGVWQKVGRQQAAQLFKQHPIETVGSALIQQVLAQAARENNTTVRDISKTPLGKRRKMHGDLTVLVLDLERQVS